jgi:hypothetical protein
VSGPSSNESAENLHNGGVVPFGVDCDSLEGIDATQAQIVVVAVELFERLRVAVGEFPGEMWGFTSNRF